MNFKFEERMEKRKMFYTVYYLRDKIKVACTDVESGDLESLEDAVRNADPKFEHIIKIVSFSRPFEFIDYP